MSLSRRAFLHKAAEPGRLQLFVEPADPHILRSCDNVTVAPWGDLVVCEDRHDEVFIRGVTAGGRTYVIARNASFQAGDERSEITGACFSPEGSTLLFNIQRAPGMAIAVQGPWDQIRGGRQA